ncbi:GTP-binding protein SAR1a [Paraconiothyrium brasiliense]|uniref:GTP-binding protein SAR1a n=1 Tax=Paraconiothyrium brasiliense TaxID=300254 RepID=A0ABR3QKE6_9PLEO
MHPSADSTGPKKTQQTYTQNLSDLFKPIRNLIPFGAPSSTPSSRLFARVPASTVILVIGLDGAGKTTLLRDYLSPRPDSVKTITPTINTGISLEDLQVGPAFFQAYDLGGCRPPYYHRFDEDLFRQADAVIYMVDAADRDRVMEAREELIMSGLRANNGGMRQGVPLLVLATKIDLENGRRPDQIETFFIDNISTSIGDRPRNVVGVNLKTGEGVSHALSWLSDGLSPRKDTLYNEKTASTEK